MRQEVIDMLEKVVMMRSRQRRYFKSRTQTDLVMSKQLENELDIELPKLIQKLKTT